MAARASFGLLALAALARAGSIADVKHVVMIMFENRSFDHYFGTMAGVRGFSDPNVQVNPTGFSTFEQLVDGSMTTLTDVLMPYNAAYLGGNWAEAAQCTWGGSNAWTQGHASYNGGLNDHWALNNTPWSVMYYERDIIPVHFSIAESFTVADMYQQSVIAATNPNRIHWMSGAIGHVPGGPQTVDEGGIILQNTCTPGCDSVSTAAQPIGCCPLKWKTVAEYAQDAGVDWRLYQDDFDVAGQDLFNIFENFENSGPGNPLYYRGSQYFNNNTLDAFYADAMNGTLPTVSWLIPEQALSEHPPWMPVNGGWLQKQIVEAVINGKSWNDTVLMISYDEEGGWFDHVTPFHSPEGTAGEWMEDPYGDFGMTFTGPGSRLPFTIISPWTRGGNVFTENADHTSQILFLEQFLQANGYDFQSEQISAWRREHMSNLVNAFDFENPDFSIPTIPDIMTPTTDANGNFIDVSICEANYPHRIPVPYGIQKPASELSSLSEQGFKPVRGLLTEGRYLTFESDGLALANPCAQGSNFVATGASNSHNDIAQRWVLHQIVEGENNFTISSAKDGRYIGIGTSFCDNSSNAVAFTINFVGSKGYTLQKENGQFVSVSQGSGPQIGNTQCYFDVFSVTYNS